MPTFDGSRFSPSAPVAAARLRNPNTGAVVDDVPMLIDTGADVTLLPKAFVDAVDLELTDAQYDVVGFAGTAYRSAAAHAELACFGKKYRGLFLIVDEPVGILGRDILNEVVLYLDGPNLVWNIVP